MIDDSQDDQSEAVESLYYNVLASIKRCIISLDPRSLVSVFINNNEKNKKVTNISNMELPDISILIFDGCNLDDVLCSCRHKSPDA